MVLILTAVLVCRGEFREAGGKNAETVSVAEMYTYKNIGVYRMETYKTEYKPQDKGYRVKRTVCRVRQTVL